MSDANSTSAIGSTGAGSSSGVDTTYANTTKNSDTDNQQIAFMNSIWKTHGTTASAFQA